MISDSIINGTPWSISFDDVQMLEKEMGSEQLKNLHLKFPNLNTKNTALATKEKQDHKNRIDISKKR